MIERIEIKDREKVDRQTGEIEKIKEKERESKNNIGMEYKIRQSSPILQIVGSLGISLQLGHNSIHR